MKLVVAEKPSVAQSLAAVLGAKQKKQGYLEGGGFLVSWCVGHLVGLAPADAYDPKYSEWTYEDLPIIPKEWKFIVDPGKKEQFKVLSDLMNRADVDSLVCATDAGREGELISGWCISRPGAANRWSVCGFRPWRRTQSKRDFPPCAPAASMTFFMLRPSVGQSRIGWWELPEPGYSPPFTEGRSTWGAS